MKTKTIATLSALLITTGVTFAYISLPTLEDKMNEQKIAYKIEKEGLEKDNKTLRVHLQAVQEQITHNSNRRNKLDGQIKQIDVTLKMLKTGELDK